MNVYGSHMGFIWESYANRSAWSVGLFDPEADAAYVQMGGAVPGPAGYFANGGFRNVGGLPRSMVFVPRHVDGVPDPSRNRGIFLSDMADHMARRCGPNRHSKNEHGGNHSGQSKHD